MNGVKPLTYFVEYILLASSHRTTESNTLQGYDKPVIDSEWGYLEISLLYMERRFEIYRIIWRYLLILNIC